jgi:NADPH-dependent 2,4-dienoyl-CoA reductase/sulfur reductase-like enzyme
MATRLVVIGGDAAGMSAASQARRLRGPDDLAILVVERGSTTSYAACGIPYWVGGHVEARDDLIARRAEVFRDKQAIDVRLHHEAVAIDLAASRITVRDLATGDTTDEAYDELLIATGATAMVPPIPGIDAPGVFGVRILDDGAAIRDALATRSPRRAVVIGAGYIGLEMAEAFLDRGLAVDVVDIATQPMTTMDPDMGERIAEGMRALGIGVHLGGGAESVEVGEDGWVTRVVTPDGALEADIVVLGTGVRPASDLARDAGVPIGPSGGIVTDERMHTPVDHVWAAGDCAETHHRVTGGPVSFALGTVANKQGRIAGLNLGGVETRFPGVLGTAITRVGDVEIARTGLSSAEAVEHGLDVVASTVEATTRSHYHPASTPIAIRTIAERGTGRLVGAQVVGGEGAGKRIDTLAMAVWVGMDVADLVDVDLSYAPPFSPVWDPVLTAARIAAGDVAPSR